MPGLAPWLLPTLAEGDKSMYIGIGTLIVIIILLIILF
jgi:hypothetical protein